MYNQHLYLLGLLCAIVAFTPLRRRDPSSSWDGTLVPRWSVTLMMFQASVVYGFGALAKLSPDFVTGRVLFTLFAQQPVTGLFGSLATNGALLGLLAAATIMVEAFLAVGLWVRRLRPVVLGIVGPLHLGMLLFLPLRLSDFLGLIAFGAIQLSLVLIMFAPEKRVLVVWDDRCSFCSQWVRAIRSLDWLQRIELQPISRPEAYLPRGISPGAALDALQLAESDGHIHAGFEAVRRIAYFLPLTMLVAPWLALRPVRAVGRAIYTRVARRRRCAVSGALPA